MKKIKKSAVANKFYTGNPAELSEQLLSFSVNSHNNSKYSSRAVIVPHAALVYSGKLAYEGINQLDKNIKNIFIFAPSHHLWFDGMAVSSYDEFETLLGNIQVNKELTQELVEIYGLNYNDEAFEKEHSVEIQLPIIQFLIGNVKIIPILVANQSTDLIVKIIQNYWKDKQNGFIISSDLSHYLTDKEAKSLDYVTAQMIENSDFTGVSPEQACGIMGIIGLCNFAKQNNFSLIRLDMSNSGVISNDLNKVVGYGSWFLYEGEKNDYIKEYYSDFILKLVKIIIESKFSKQQIEIKYPMVFDEVGACFVTIEKQGQLRGCIGSVDAYQPLIQDIIDHASDAAFNDKRFAPVTFDELEHLSFSVSLLSKHTPIDFLNEDELMDKLVPLEDGLIIKDDNYRAIYLPSVWEQIPDKRIFLTSLKVKAGMSPDYFSKSLKAFKFKTVLIK